MDFISTKQLLFTKKQEYLPSFLFEKYLLLPIWTRDFASSYLFLNVFAFGVNY